MGPRNEPSASADLTSHWPDPSAPPPATATWLASERRADTVATARVPLLLTLSLFALAFLLPAWPWLSGTVTIPWDAKSQFYPQVQFLASSLARGEWPWWSPNVFAGWSQISDPQSLLFAPQIGRASCRKERGCRCSQYLLNS